MNVVPRRTGKVTIQAAQTMQGGLKDTFPKTSYKGILQISRRSMYPLRKPEIAPNHAATRDWPPPPRAWAAARAPEAIKTLGGTLKGNMATLLYKKQKQLVVAVKGTPRQPNTHTHTHIETEMGGWAAWTAIQRTLTRKKRLLGRVPQK